MDPLRVGFFTEVYRPVVNGVVASVDALAHGLRARGHAVYCFAPRVPGYAESDGPVFRMPSLPLPTRTAYRLTVPLVSRRNLNRVIKRLSVVHVHSPFITGWMGLRYSRRYGMPLVYTYHTQLEAYAHYVPFEPNATRFATSRLTRTFANSSDAVVVPTNAMARHLRQLGVSARIEVVPSGIDVDFFGSGRRDAALRRRLRIGEGETMLLYVGRVAKEKNVELLIEALALAAQRSLRLVVAGDGPAREHAELLARRLGLESHVRFLGAVRRADLPALYASADAFVMPSVTETQGLVLAEAMAAGVHVIAADAPPNREVLGDQGIVVAATPHAFAAAFQTVPPAPLSSTAAAAKEAAAAFSQARATDRILSLYGSLARPARVA
ncbi:MAG: glycosyltransferase [Candidatus Eremiobacteraeota bacterium]|nr:glycosyltransferase [Candidatus Eremiobacteraeota bacterium]MBV9263256.1 glycosyltransferase [Candidatus Eremiobacteraeota bacterium]